MAVRNRSLLFLALAVSINFLVVYVARSGARPVAIGAVLDMTVTVPALYYFLLVRRGERTIGSLGLVALLSVWRASFAFPGIVPGKAWLGAAVEVLAIAAIVLGVRRVRRAEGEGDPAARIQAAARGLLPFRGAEQGFAAELTVLYYGLAWRAKPHVEAGSQSFTLHQRSGIQDIFLFVGLASLLEIPPVHLVLAQWSGVAAWVATGLSLYGAFWMVSLSRAFGLRPTLVGDEEIRLRFGLLEQLRIPVSAIRSVTREIPHDAVVLPRRATPELYLEFTHPLEIEKPMGLRKSVSGIAVGADDGPAFEKAVLAAFRSGCR